MLDALYDYTTTGSLLFRLNRTATLPLYDSKNRPRLVLLSVGIEGDESEGCEHSTVDCSCNRELV